MIFMLRLRSYLIALPYYRFADGLLGHFFCLILTYKIMIADLIYFVKHFDKQN